MSKKDNFDCPHCGQDLRLSPNAKDEISIAEDRGFAKGYKAAIEQFKQEGKS